MQTAIILSIRCFVLNILQELSSSSLCWPRPVLFENQLNCCELIIIIIIIIICNNITHKSGCKFWFFKHPLHCMSLCAVWYRVFVALFWKEFCPLLYSPVMLAANHFYSPATYFIFVYIYICWYVLYASV
jgi:hypothetical protein